MRSRQQRMIALTLIGWLKGGFVNTARCFSCCDGDGNRSGAMVIVGVVNLGGV